VWVDPNGALVDITPKADREARVLFIPDPNRVYENVPIDNVRVILSNKPAFLNAIRAQEQFAKLRIKYNVDGREARIPVSELQALGLTNEPAFRKKTGRNEPCPCGSGKKFKLCHGR
jgi:uncharacterized protein YecA (UPF0149 family)